MVETSGSSGVENLGTPVVETLVTLGRRYVRAAPRSFGKAVLVARG
ncbi:hypothetical protein ACWD5R_15725 [Streptomyces sp. NPDC002514]